MVTRTKHIKKSICTYLRISLEYKQQICMYNLGVCCMCNVYTVHIGSGAFYSNRKWKACLSFEWGMCVRVRASWQSAKPSVLPLRKIIKSIASHTCKHTSKRTWKIQNRMFSSHVQMLNTLYNTMQTQHNPFFGRAACTVRIIGFALFAFVVEIFIWSESETNGKHDHTINIAHTQREKDRENNKEKSKTFEAKSAGGGECGVHRIQYSSEQRLWYGKFTMRHVIRQESGGCLLSMGNVWNFLTMHSEIHVYRDTDTREDNVAYGGSVDIHAAHAYIHSNSTIIQYKSARIYTVHVCAWNFNCVYMYMVCLCFLW